MWEKDFYTSVFTSISLPHLLPAYFLSSFSFIDLFILLLYDTIIDNSVATIELLCRLSLYKKIFENIGK